ncbi:MAG: hypothetical protein KC609_16790 [Myxococcales bacterium]|nr:hypothetical protein [Myxococcales bacterium]
MGSVITVGVIGAIFLFMGIFSLIKKELPVLGFPEWFEGSKGKLLSIGLTLVGVVFALSALFAPEAAMSLINRAFRGCSRQ